MWDNQVSLTSLITAYIRAYHSRHEEPKIFNDFLAYELLSDEQRSKIGDKLALRLQSINPELAASNPDQTAALAPVMRSMGSPTILSRARYTEDRLEEAVNKGISQYVILGAGMDTFAFRKPELLQQLQVFEVDHPATQGFKRRRIAELGWEVPFQLHYVEVDFTKGDLGTVLKAAGYNSSVPTFFSWLGVTMYLDRETVFSSLRDIASFAPAGSAIVFDYLHSDALSPEKINARMQRSREGVARLGEPMKSGFNPSGLAGDLAVLGLHLHQNLNPSDIEARYFQGRYGGYSAHSHGHFAWAVVEHQQENRGLN